MHAEFGLPAHIFRLGGIYGPGRSVLDSLAAQSNDLSSSQRRRGRQRYTARCHVYDICAVLAASMSRTHPGRVYNVVDDDPAPRGEVMSYARALVAGATSPYDSGLMSPAEAPTQRRPEGPAAPAAPTVELGVAATTTAAQQRPTAYQGAGLTATVASASGDTDAGGGDGGGDDVPIGAGGGAAGSSQAWSGVTAAAAAVGSGSDAAGGTRPWSGQADRPGTAFSSSVSQPLSSPPPSYPAAPSPSSPSAAMPPQPASPSSSSSSSSSSRPSSPSLFPAPSSSSSSPSPAREGSLEEKRVRNGRIRDELGVELRYPTYREGVAAILEGDVWPLAAEDLALL